MSEPDRRAPREPVDPATAEFPVVDRRGLGKVYDPDRHPRQRASDAGWRYWIGWLYKHTVPALAIGVAAFAVHSSSGATSKAEHNAKVARELSAANRRALVAIQEGRRAAIGESCRQDERLADVVRKALLGFGVGRPGNPAPRAVAEAFRPLGGLKPLTAKERGERCADRIRRGGP
jgi:hypothetical protein